MLRISAVSARFIRKFSMILAESRIRQFDHIYNDILSRVGASDDDDEGFSLDEPVVPAKKAPAKKAPAKKAPAKKPVEVDEDGLTDEDKEEAEAETETEAEAEALADLTDLDEPVDVEDVVEDEFAKILESGSGEKPRAKRPDIELKEKAKEKDVERDISVEEKKNIGRGIIDVIGAEFPEIYEAIENGEDSPFSIGSRAYAKALPQIRNMPSGSDESLDVVHSVLAYFLGDASLRAAEKEYDNRVEKWDSYNREMRTWKMLADKAKDLGKHGNIPPEPKKPEKRDHTPIPEPDVSGVDKLGLPVYSKRPPISDFKKPSFKSRGVKDWSGALGMLMEKTRDMGQNVSMKGGSRPRSDEQTVANYKFKQQKINDVDARIKSGELPANYKDKLPGLKFSEKENQEYRGAVDRLTKEGVDIGKIEPKFHRKQTKIFESANAPVMKDTDDSPSLQDTFKSETETPEDEAARHQMEESANSVMSQIRDELSDWTPDPQSDVPKGALTVLFDSVMDTDGSFNPDSSSNHGGNIDFFKKLLESKDEKIRKYGDLLLRKDNPSQRVSDLRIRLKKELDRIVKGMAGEEAEKLAGNISSGEMNKLWAKLEEAHLFESERAESVKKLVDLEDPDLLDLDEDEFSGVMEYNKRNEEKVKVTDRLGELKYIQTRRGLTDDEKNEMSVLVGKVKKGKWMQPAPYAHKLDMDNIEIPTYAVFPNGKIEETGVSQIVSFADMKLRMQNGEIPDFDDIPKKGESGKQTDEQRIKRAEYLDAEEWMIDNYGWDIMESVVPMSKDSIKKDIEQSKGIRFKKSLKSPKMSIEEYKRKKAEENARKLTTSSDLSLSGFMVAVRLAA